MPDFNQDSSAWFAGVKNHGYKDYVLKGAWLFVTPWTIACQVGLSMKLSRQKYWSGLPFPSPGDLPNLGVKPMTFVSPALAGRFFYYCVT